MSVQMVSIPSQNSNSATETCSAAWKDLRNMLRDRFGETAYRRWLEPMTGDVASDNAIVPQITLTLPTRFMRDWVEAHYGDTIRTMRRGGVCRYVALDQGNADQKCHRWHINSADCAFDPCSAFGDAACLIFG